MKRKIVLLSLLAAMVLSLCGCSDETTAANKSDNTKKAEDEPVVEGTYQYQAAEVYNYVDPETGVCYLIYSGYRAGGMTVRYNADGSIMVKQQ